MAGQEGVILIGAKQAQIWTLTTDRKLLCLNVPELPILGLPQPLRVTMHFDARTVDAMLERLTVLRAQMLPALPSARERN